MAQQRPHAAPPGLETQYPGTGDEGATYRPRGQKRPWEAAQRPPRNAGRVHNVVDGVFQTNRRGKSLCEGFNLGTCTDCDSASRACRQDQSKMHLCKLCLASKHGAHQCNRTEASAPLPGLVARQGKGKGGGGWGKGKGKKGKGKGWGKYNQW